MSSINNDELPDDGIVKRCRCAKCGKSFEAYYYALLRAWKKLHIITDHPRVPKFVCPVVWCDKYFDTTDRYTKHITSRHGGVGTLKEEEMATYERMLAKEEEATKTHFAECFPFPFPNDTKKK